LFASSPGGSIDLRHDESRGLFEAAVVRSLAPVPDPAIPSPPPATTPATTPAATPAAAPAPDPVPEPAARLAAEPSRSAGSLPVTGSDSDTLLAAAGVLVVAGVAAVVAAGSPTS
jgi:LPXTG-motif cell wall-anchored protein